MKNKDQVKRQPTYDLQECKRLTRINKIRIPKRIKDHIKIINENVPYDFTPDLIQTFIENLTENDFSKSILYQDNEQWFDVYVKKHHFIYINSWDEKLEEVMTLYFKYFIQDNELFVQVISFHPER